MHHRHPSALIFCAAFALLFSHAPAQTATWIGTGFTTTEDWSDGANWSTGVVPNSPTSIAVIDQTVSSNPGANGIRIFSTTIDLDELRFAANTSGSTYAWPPPVHLTGPEPRIGSTLNLYGAGITVSNTGDSNLLPVVQIGPSSEINFYNSATITGPATGTGGLVIQLDPPAFVGSSTLNFHDQSSAGFVAISLAPGSGHVNFTGQSSAAQSYITASQITFADQATAGTSHLSTFAHFSTITFGDQASAGSASITLLDVTGAVFADQADAGTATITYASGVTAGVSISDQATTTGLTLRTAASPGNSTAVGGSLNMSGAAGDVTLRAMNGMIRVNLGANTLRFDQLAAGETMQIAGEISGTGGLAFLSPGNITVTNPNSAYTGPTLIHGAAVTLNNGRVNQVQLDLGGSLTGAGTIGGNLGNTRGTVRPAGTLTVLGDFIQTPDPASAHPTVLGIGLGGPNRLVVGGTAQLGGTLALTSPANSFVVGSRSISFLTAGNITGQFNTVTLNGSALSGTAMRSSRIAYTPAAVSFVVEQHPFADAGTTPSRRALGAHLDATLGPALGDYFDLLANLNSFPTTAAVDAALAQLSPDRYGVLVEQGFAASASRQAGLDRRLAALRAGETTGRVGTFFEGGSRRSTFDAVAGLPRVGFTASQQTAGAAWRAGSWALGATVTSERSRADLDPDGSHAEVKSVVPGVFVQYASGPLFLNAQAAFSRDDYELRRHLVYPGLDQTATAAPSGRRTDLALTAGYAFRTGGWTFTPTAGVLGSRWRMDDFAETGAGAASLVFSDWSDKSVRSRVGAEVACPSGNGWLTPRLSVMWLHDFEEARPIQARLADTTGAYTAPGRPGERDLVQASLTVDFQLRRAFALYAGLGGAWGRNSTVTADFSAGLHWTF